MASRQFIYSQMTKIEKNFGKERFKFTQELFEIWNDVFKDYDEEGLKKSVDECIKSSEYPPTVASIVKIYNAKNEYRKEMLSYLKGKYLWLNRWIEQTPTQEEFSWFCKYIMTFEKDKRKGKVEEIASDVISRYNSTHENKTLRGWLNECGTTNNSFTFDESIKDR